MVEDVMEEGAIILFVVFAILVFCGSCLLGIVLLIAIYSRQKKLNNLLMRLEKRFPPLSSGHLPRPAGEPSSKDASEVSGAAPEKPSDIAAKQKAADAPATSAPTLAGQAATAATEAAEPKPSSKPPPASQALMDSDRIKARRVSALGHSAEKTDSSEPEAAPTGGEPREPGELERRSLEILGKIWSWIIVGQEFRNPEVSMEYAIASVWLIRAGVVMLILTASFFLNYSIEHGLLSDKARMCLTAAAGIAMLGIGMRLAGKKYHVVAMGLVGGGIATLYGAVFAGFAMFHLFSAGLAFGLMVAVTVVAGGVSLRLDSMFVAILGLIGGYATPLLINTGQVNYPGLFSYLTILGVGALWIAKHKDWRLLNILAFFSTYAIFALSLSRGYSDSRFGEVFPFLCGFFLLFSFIPILNNIINGRRSTIVEMAFMTLNAMVFHIAAYMLIKGKYDNAHVAIATASAAAFYIVQVCFLTRRKLDDPALLVTLSGLAAFFITYTVPLLLSDEWITTGWALQALVFMWMSARLRSRFIRTMSHALFALALCRVALFDLHRDFLHVKAIHYWGGMLGRFATFGVVILSLVGAYIILKRERDGTLAASKHAGTFRDNDVSLGPLSSNASNWFFWLAAACVFIYFQFECFHFFDAFYVPARMPSLTMVWLAGIIFVFTLALRSGSLTLAVVTFFLVVGLLGKLAFFDIPGWDFRIDALVYSDTYGWDTAAMRLLDFIPAVGVFAYCACVLGWGAGAGKGKGSSNGNGNPHALFAFLAISTLFLYTTLELNTLLFFKARGFQAGGVSILWGIFAISFIIGGILRASKTLRYAGLALFAVVIGKVIFFDMCDLDQLYRIIAFFVLSLIILGGAVVYVRFRQFFETSPSS